MNALSDGYDGPRPSDAGAQSALPTRVSSHILVETSETSLTKDCAASFMKASIAIAAHTWLDHPARGQKIAGRTNRELARAMDRIIWLICRINDPVMRSMFMSPSDRFYMRDGIINMLAGNLRSAGPIICFKHAYHFLTALHRRGRGGELLEKTPAAMLSPGE